MSSSAPYPRRWIPLCLWCLLLIGALSVRTVQLDARPFHADEATGASITAQRMAGSGGHFNPSHYHGPLLWDLAAPLCRARGETSWQTMSASTLRLLPALAGTLLCLSPIWICRNAGRWPPFLAAACLASSPLLVFYSRTFIHEMLLTLFGAAAIACCRSPRHLLQPILPGACLGAMLATKESVAITAIAWGLAALCTLALQPGLPATDRRALQNSLWSNAATALTVAAWCYSEGGSHPSGIVDAVKTFFVYQTGAGHEKPPGYYFNLLISPHHALGNWWSEGGVACLALLGWLRLERLAAHHRSTPPKALPIARFLALSALFHTVIYSLIPYKTPWLMCLPWCHVCLLAGFAATSHPLPSVRPASHWHPAVILLAGLTLAFQCHQTYLSCFRFHSDPRNRLSYVPSHPDVLALSQWLANLARQSAHLPPTFNISVVGTNYWPLPWYLRSVPHVGYWPSPHQKLQQASVVISMPDQAPVVAHQLAHSHVLLPRGLRVGFPIHVAVRSDHWNAWMQTTPSH